MLLKYKPGLLYGCSLAALLFLLKWLEYRFILISYAFEVYVTAIAILFTALGIWLAIKLSKPKIERHIETIIIEKEVAPRGTFVCNEEARLQLGISARELEVLQLVAAGYSNNEIAEKLFLSLPTIKTHIANLFQKLDVKRRTAAVDKAKKIQLIS